MVNQAPSFSEVGGELKMVEMLGPTCAGYGRVAFIESDLQFLIFSFYF